MGATPALASHAQRDHVAKARGARRDRSTAACAAKRARARTACEHPHHAVKAKAPRRRAAVPGALAASRISALSSAAVIAEALAAPCPNTELIPTPGDIEALRTAVLCLVNRVRAEHDETPLMISADLEKAGEEHGQELVADDYFAHVTPSGFTPVDRIRTTGYIPSPEVGYVIGENLAWGTLNLSTPASIVAAWVASPGHLANILESQYTETGIGIVPAVPSSLGDGQQGATYAQEFGVIIR